MPQMEQPASVASCRVDRVGRIVNSATLVSVTVLLLWCDVYAKRWSGVGELCGNEQGVVGGGRKEERKKAQHKSFLQAPAGARSLPQVNGRGQMLGAGLRAQ